MGLWKTSAEEPSYVEKIDIEQLASIIRESGYKALIEQDADKRSFVSSAQQGWNTVVYLLPEGKSILFALWMLNEPQPLSLAEVNDFNIKCRYAKLTLHSEGQSLRLALDVDLEGGVSQLYLAKRIALWDSILGILRNYVAETTNQTVPRA